MASGWWQLKNLLFSPRNLGEMIQFDYIIFFKMGWVETTNEACFFTTLPGLKAIPRQSGPKLSLVTSGGTAQG